jgi:hypothetical protein
MVLEPTTDPYCIGLEGIRLAKATSQILESQPQLLIQLSFGGGEIMGY